MNYSMNQPNAQDKFVEAFSKNFIIVFIGSAIICINGTFVFTFFRSSAFYRDSRYILYIHLVINDMLMIFFTVTLFVMSYAWQNLNVSFCCSLLLIASTTHKITPLNLAGMAVERYIAVCKPLHHSQICTVHRTYILIGLMWGVGIIPGLVDVAIAVIINPLLFFNTITICYTPFLYSSVFHDQNSKATQSIFMPFVWVVLVYTYCRVLVAAKKMSTDKVSAKKAQSTILLHGLQQLLCMMSYINVLLDELFLLIWPTHRTKIYFFTYLLANISPRLLSPLIYGVRDQKFVKHMKRQFSCKKIKVEIKELHNAEM